MSALDTLVASNNLMRNMSENAIAHSTKWLEYCISTGIGIEKAQRNLDEDINEAKSTARYITRTENLIAELSAQPSQRSI